MVAAAGVGFGGLVLFGVPPGTALRFALLLACPLMMVWMMVSMSGSGHDGAGCHDQSEHRDAAPDDREEVRGR